jgi:hypothetical protein
MDELKLELPNQWNSYSANKQHKIICIGDSHTRGFTNMLKNLMGNNFELCSVVKPGPNSSHLLETATQDLKKRSFDDILVICSCTNDLATKSALAFQNISNMVTRNNHTNIILINILHRYDTINTTPPMIILRNSIRNWRKLLTLSI